MVGGDGGWERWEVGKVGVLGEYDEDVGVDEEGSVEIERYVVMRGGISMICQY